MVLSTSEKNFLIFTVLIPLILAYLVNFLKYYYIKQLKLTPNNTHPRLFTSKLYKLSDGDQTTFNVYETPTKTKKTIITPTPQVQKIAGKAIRCDSAFYNSIESLTVYTPGLIFSCIWAKSEWVVVIFGIIYLLARICYIPLYVFAETQCVSYFRTICFLFGMMASVGMYLQALAY